MALEYYSILTAIGTAAVANAAVLGEKVNLTQFAVGDGGGSYYRPTKDMTALKGEKWRGEINDYAIDSLNPDLIRVKGVIPGAVGGFTIREMGIFDSQGRLIAIANTPDSVKITTDSGAVKEMELVMELLVSNADVVKIEVNPTVSIATKEDIEKHNISNTAHKALFDSKAANVHKHSASDITSGILPMDKGGTGNSTGHAATAAKLSAARTIQTNLGSTGQANFDGSANITPGVTGTLPITNGGTGAAAASAALSNLGGFPKTGGTISGDTTIQGNLRLQNKSLNYNTKINFGDADYVYIREYTDNNMEIKANNVNFVVSGNVTQNNKKIGAATQEEIEALFSVFAKNMALGYNALKENTSGICNIALGHSALEKNTTGKYNVALGLTTLNANTSGFNNVAIGQNALKANTSSSNNVAIGYNTLNNNTSGSNNVAIGYNALNGLTSYSFCTGLGYNTQVTGSNQVQLGDVTATVYAQKAVVTRSDARDKADIADSDLGLDFILRSKQ